MQNIKLDLINFNNKSSNHSLIPFLFRLSNRLKIKSHFKKVKKDIHISIEGNPQIVENFILKIQNKTKYLIKESSSSLDWKFLINKGLCIDCLNEIFNKESKRYRYHLTSCNHCGPKLSYLKNLPFERKNTSFKNFEMCPDCEKEIKESGKRYNYPLNSCSKCGPSLKLVDPKGNNIPCKDVIGKAAYLMNKGEVLAIKAFWGYHLAASGSHDSTVKKMKELSPFNFELVFFSIDDIDKMFEVNATEKKLLLNNNILNLKLRYRYNLSTFLPNNNGNIYCKIAQSSLQFLLLSELEEPFFIEHLISKHDEPPLLDETLTAKYLNEQIDYFLTYDLPIVTPAKSTSYKKSKQRTVTFKPSVESFNIQSDKPIISFGDDKNPSIAITSKKETIYLPFNFKLNNFLALKRYKENYNWLRSISGIKNEKYVLSQEPNAKLDKYTSSKQETLRVQHHHAHVASVMAENSLDEDVISVIFDSGGYMNGDKFSGAEFFIANLSSYKRVAFFEDFYFPEFEACIDEPWRIAMVMLIKTFGERFFPYPQLFNGVKQQEIGLIKAMVSQKVNCQNSNSMTMLLNGFASLIGLSSKNKYTNQAFEKFTDVKMLQISPYQISINDFPKIKITPLIRQIYHDTFTKKPEELINLIRKSITHLIIQVLLRLHKQYKIDKIVITGDFFEEEHLFDDLLTQLSEKNFICYTNKRLPLNDFNIALGQSAIAAKSNKKPPAA